MSVTVREATREDVPWLVQQMRAFDRFYGTKHSLFPDLFEATRTVTSLVECHPFWVAETKAGLVGFIAGALMPHPFNTSLIVFSEMFWWVDAQHRGSRAGALLLAEFIAFGDSHANWTVMTLEERSPVNPSTLEKRGFRLHERSYLREVA